jgi:hypothetical protein
MLRPLPLVSLENIFNLSSLTTKSRVVKVLAINLQEGRPLLHYCCQICFPILLLQILNKQSSIRVICRMKKRIAKLTLMLI